MKQNLKSRKDIVPPYNQNAAFAGHIQPKELIIPTRWIRLATLGVGLLWGYFLLVLVYDETILGIHVGLRYLLPAIVASFGSLYWLGLWVYRRQLVSETRLKDLAVASIAVLLPIVAVDIGYSLYLNAINLSVQEEALRRRDWSLYSQESDWQLWHYQLFPRSFYPTEKNFQLNKPNQAMSSDVYGAAYYRKLIESPTIANLVLERRHISYAIDEHGFRETTPLEQAHIFALGDSFTIGDGISQDKTWVERLEQEIGKPVYNLGFSDCSPKQQLMLLEYMLQTEPDSIKIRHLLWMIFESNNLEGSYETLRPVLIQEEDSSENLFAGTLVGTLNSLPLTIKEQSVINRLRAGQIPLTLPARDTRPVDPYSVDGIKLLSPLYHSSKYGYRLFDQDYVERAGKSESYVFDHPNRPLLDQTFKDMVSLSRKYGFEVTVIIAPSAPRLYGPYFENLPPISQEPYFINHVENLSKGLGFDVINLYPLMQPYAEAELLYWRDDTHWNERGHEVAVEIITEQLADDVVSSGD